MKCKYKIFHKDMGCLCSVCKIRWSVVIFLPICHLKSVGENHPSFINYSLVLIVIIHVMAFPLINRAANCNFEYAGYIGVNFSFFLATRQILIERWILHFYEFYLMFHKIYTCLDSRLLYRGLMKWHLTR